MKKEINKKLLAEVLHAYSVSHATQNGSELHITFRDKEEDNSSWVDLNIHELVYLYKKWAFDKGRQIATVQTSENSFKAWDINSNILYVNDTSEAKAIRLLCEELYEIFEKGKV